MGTGGGDPGCHPSCRNALSFLSILQGRHVGPDMVVLLVQHILSSKDYHSAVHYSTLQYTTGDGIRNAAQHSRAMVVTGPGWNIWKC